ncbi:MAG: Wzz/FepE/Etk N-terminal domain-containing protein [bacterium]|nr:Wzz/FepE/Etk N-terminal domain-containing protein [bacterium]
MFISMEKFIKLLQNNLRVIAAWTVIFTLIGVGLTFILPKYYRATGVFYLISDEKFSSSSISDLLMNVSNLSKGFKSGIDIEHLIETEFVRNKVIARTELMKKKSIEKKIDAYMWLKESISINPYNDGMVKLSCKEKDPLLARDIVEAYLFVIDSFYRESGMFVARNYRIYLEKREKELLTQMQSSMTAMQNYQRENNIIYPEIEYKTLYENVIAPIKQNMLEVTLRKAREEEIFGDKSSSLVSEKELDISSEILDQLYSENNKIMSALNKFPEKVKNYILLKLNTDISVSLYTTVKAELEKAILEEKRDIPSMHIIDIPEIPEEHFFPRKRDGAFVGFILGIICACLYVYLRNARLLRNQN